MSATFAFTQGQIDAQRGHTACPYGVSAWAREWSSGYDKAVREGLAVYPRFGTSKRRAR